MRRALLALLCAAFILALPQLWLRLTSRIHTVASAPQAEAALIFGALVRDGTISPLHRERLDAGIALLEAGRVDVIVVSNSERAARAMLGYLQEQGVPEGVIEIDASAPHTPATCRNEVGRASRRDVLFVSQRFHLPRIGLQCARAGLKGALVEADGRARAPTDLLTRLKVRGYRAMRECVLTWAALTGIYSWAEKHF